MLQQKCSETKLVEQTYHGISNKMELQMKTLETSKVTKVETVNEVTVPEVDTGHQQSRGIL